MVTQTLTAVSPGNVALDAANKAETSDKILFTIPSSRRPKMIDHVLHIYSGLRLHLCPSVPVQRPVMILVCVTNDVNKKHATASNQSFVAVSLFNQAIFKCAYKA